MLPRVVLDATLVHAMPACVTHATTLKAWRRWPSPPPAWAAPITLRLVGCCPVALASAGASLGPEAAARVILSS